MVKMEQKGMKKMEERKKEGEVDNEEIEEGNKNWTTKKRWLTK